MSRFARHWHWPVQKRVEQRPCVTREIETWLSDSRSVTIEWLNTEADDQSSLQCVVALTGATSDHIWRQDASCGGGCSKISASMGQFGWTSMIWSMLSVAALQHRERGATLVRTGSHKTCIARRQPEIRELYNFHSQNNLLQSTIHSFSKEYD